VVLAVAAAAAGGALPPRGRATGVVQREKVGQLPQPPRVQRAVVQARVQRPGQLVDRLLQSVRRRWSLECHTCFHALCPRSAVGLLDMVLEAVEPRANFRWPSLPDAALSGHWFGASPHCRTPSQCGMLAPGRTSRWPLRRAAP